MQAQKIAKTKLDSQRHGGFSLDGSKKKAAYMGSLTGNSELEGTNSCKESTLKAVSASRDSGGGDLSMPGASVMSSLVPSLSCKSYESKPATVTSFGSAEKKKKMMMMSTSSVSSPQNEVAVASASEANSVLKASLTACVKGQTFPASADLPVIASPKVAVNFVGRTVSVGHTTSSASASKQEKAPGKLMVPPAHRSKESHILTSRKELPKKCSERKQKRITGSKTHLKTSDADQKPWTDFKKFQGSWQRQCGSDREGCHVLLASALPRHSGSSYISETKLYHVPFFESDGEKGTVTPPSETIANAKRGTSLLYKPHQSTLLPSPLTAAFPGSDTIKIKLLHPSSDEAAFMQCSESASQVQPYHVNSATIHSNFHVCVIHLCPAA